jgi:hypothetical protein
LKQNVADEYAFMLLSQVLAKLIDQKEKLDALGHILGFKIPVVVIQILSRILQTQSSDGSWSDGSHEITAYCVLALMSLNDVPFPMALNDKTGTAIDAGRAYLRLAKGVWRPEPIWVEKVRYCSPLLTEMYCTCALLAPVRHPQVSAAPHTSSIKMLYLFGKLPLFRSLSHPQLTLELALAESQAFLPYLQSTRLAIFPRSKDLKKEKYMEIIPLAWTACNALREKPLPAEILMEMMSISLLNFQADEYFELITSKRNTRALSWLVNKACCINADPQEDDLDRGARAADAPTPPEEESLGHDLAAILSVVQKYADRILQHAAVASAPQRVQLNGRQKLAAYLQAQIISAASRSPNPDARTKSRTLFG